MVGQKSQNIFVNLSQSENEIGFSDPEEVTGFALTKEENEEVEYSRSIKNYTSLASTE